MTTFLNGLSDLNKDRKAVVLSVEEYFEHAKDDPYLYALPAERLAKAIGEATTKDSNQDSRLAALYGNNRQIPFYDSMDGFFGIEDSLNTLVKAIQKASMGLEESRQILYLKGPVGGGKSSLAQRLADLFESEAFYTVQVGDKISEIYESPINLILPHERQYYHEQFGIPLNRMNGTRSPWLTKRLNEIRNDIDTDGDGNVSLELEDVSLSQVDLNEIHIVKVFPSAMKNIGISRLEASDVMTQNVGDLIGRTNVRRLEEHDEVDPDSYSFKSGALCLASNGLIEMVEIFKADDSLLKPLISATQDRKFAGSNGVGMIPFDGIILAHSNESEWARFLSNPDNAAHADRIIIVDMPYCLRITEEALIHEAMLSKTKLAQCPKTPGALEPLAELAVLSRLNREKVEDIEGKLLTYDGQNVKETHPKVKSLMDYRDAAGLNEGMTGLSTRFIQKVISEAAFTNESGEPRLSAISVVRAAESILEKDQKIDPAVKEQALEDITNIVRPKVVETIEKHIRAAYFENLDDYGQNTFDRYIDWVDNWKQKTDFRDPETGILSNQDALNQKLTSLEKKASISNPKEFRLGLLDFVLRYRAEHQNANPAWNENEKYRALIESSVSQNLEDILPVISTRNQKTEKDQQRHSDFMKQMKESGYDDQTAAEAVSYYVSYKNSQ